MYPISHIPYHLTFISNLPFICSISYLLSLLSSIFTSQAYPLVTFLLIFSSTQGIHSLTHSHTQKHTQALPTAAATTHKKGTTSSKGEGEGERHEEKCVACFWELAPTLPLDMASISASRNRRPKSATASLLFLQLLYRNFDTIFDACRKLNRRRLRGGREARLAPQLSQRRKTNRLTEREREREDERKPKTDSKMRTVRPGQGSGGNGGGRQRQLGSSSLLGRGIL